MRERVASISFRLGPYTVLQRPRFDSPAWAVYIVHRGDKYVGKSFSRPDEGCCQWLERQELNRIIYAEQSANLPRYSMPRRGRPSNAERKRRAELAAMESLGELTT